MLRSAAEPDAPATIDAIEARNAPRPRRVRPSSLLLFVAARPLPQASRQLSEAGWRCLWMPDPAQAIAVAALARVDALVVDLATLGGAGARWLTRLRRSLHCPIVAVGIAGGEADEIRALDLGADAYQRLPLSPRRLQAQVAAVLRLRHAADHGSPPAVPAAALPRWRVDRIDNRLLGPDLALDLTDAQGALLHCLLDAAGRVVPRAALAAALPRGDAVRARSIDVYVHRLRRRLHQVTRLGIEIEACRGRGYRLVTAPA